MILVQVWAIPALGVSGEFVIDGPQPIKIREVDYQPNGKTSKILLFETSDPATELVADLGTHFKPIAKVVARASFSALTQIRAFAGRLIANPPEPGQRYEAVEILGPPPGFPFHTYPMGSFQRVLDQAFLVGNVPTNVEGAISWFIAGLHSAKAPAALMCYWLGIEMLAPEKKGLLRCPNRGCEKEIPTCPQCNKPTTEPKATKAIVEYLTDEFHLSKKEARRLYQQRNDVAHGRVNLDEAGINAVESGLVQTRDILLAGIKKALKLPPDHPPNISTSKLLGTAMAYVGDVMGTGSYLDLPAVSVWEAAAVLLPIGEFHGIPVLAGAFSGSDI